MAENTPLLGALGLCRKAGKLVMGFDAVAESVMKGKAFLVLTAADVSPRTARKTNEFCEGLVPCLSMPLTQDVLCAVEGASNRRNLTEKGVVVLITRAVYHILSYAIRLMEKESRREKEK